VTPPMSYRVRCGRCWGYAISLAMSACSFFTPGAFCQVSRRSRAAHTGPHSRGASKSRSAPWAPRTDPPLCPHRPTRDGWTRRSGDGGGNCALPLVGWALTAKERRWCLKTNVRMRDNGKKRKKRLREIRRLRRCGNGNVNENISCLRKQEGLYRA
jgi:hypothetical protein